MITNVPTTPEQREVMIQVADMILNQINQMSEFKWYISSHFRDSVSHRYGWAIDYAPVAQHLTDEQGNLVDPQLNKRMRFLNSLKLVKDRVNAKLRNIKAMFFVESNHIHLQLYQPQSPTEIPLVIAWPWQHASYLHSDDLIKDIIAERKEQGYE